MTGTPHAEEDILAKFTREYRETLPEKERLIAELVQNFKADMSLDNLKALRIHIHRIAGSAGTYGFTQASVVCREFEKELLDKIDHFVECPGDPSWIAGFESYFRRIKEAFKS